ncbi:MAG: hypothetical protein V3G42_10750 [Oscillospiraceae bacterium]
MKKKLVEVGFISSTRIVFDATESYRSYEVNTSAIIPAFNPHSEGYDKITFPNYNISTRQLYQFNHTPVEIIPASAPPLKPDQNLFFMLMPTVLMVFVLIFARTATITDKKSAFSMILFSASMSVVTILTTITNWIRQRKKYQNSLKKWRKEYEDYIDKLVNEILERQKKDTNKLDELYPDICELIDDKNKTGSIYEVCGDLFSRCSEDLDYMTIRLGISDMVDNQFEIRGSRKDVIFSSTGFKIKFDKVKVYITDDEEYDNKEDETFYLTNLPNYISNKYQYMKRAPLLYSLKDCGALGIVSPNPIFAERLIQRMVFDLCFYHSPDDLQFIILFEPTEERDKIESCVEIYKFMPHFRNLFPEQAQFVFDEKNANMVFSTMLRNVK